MQNISISFFHEGTHLFSQYLQCDVNLKNGDLIYLEHKDSTQEGKDDLEFTHWKVKRVDRVFKHNVYENKTRTQENPFPFQIHNDFQIEVAVVKYKKFRFFQMPSYRWKEKSIIGKVADLSRKKDGIFEFLCFGVSYR